MIGKGHFFHIVVLFRKHKVSLLFVKPAILFRNNEGRGHPFKGPAWFNDTKFDHVVKLFFESLLVYVRNRVNVMMYQLSSIFEVNVNLFVRIDSKGAIKYFCVCIVH